MEYDLDIFSDLPAEIFDSSIDTFLSRILNEFKKEYSDYVEKHSDECMYLKMPRLLCKANTFLYVTTIYTIYAHYASPEMSWYLSLQWCISSGVGSWNFSAVSSNKEKYYAEKITTENIPESMKKLVEFIFE